MREIKIESQGTIKIVNASGVTDEILCPVMTDTPDKPLRCHKMCAWFREFDTIDTFLEVVNNEVGTFAFCGEKLIGKIIK